MNDKELRFRAWDKLGQKYFYYDSPFKSHFILSLDGKFTNLHNGTSGDDYIVQQWTGLQDKNGRDIYHGDYVKEDETHIAHLLRRNDKSHYTIGRITWLREGWHVCQYYLGSEELHDFTMCDYCPCGLDIIGNIFENPELNQAFLDYKEDIA